MKVEIVKDDWTAEDLRRELLIWRGIELGKTQFYEWAKYALIKPDYPNCYTDRDREKLLKFARLMARYRNLKLSSLKLYQELQKEEQTNGHEQRIPAF